MLKLDSHGNLPGRPKKAFGVPSIFIVTAVLPYSLNPGKQSQT